jgi:tetratricopeptide (TPR) repeat protein
VTKPVVDRRMLVLVLCGWLGESPAIAASQSPKPLAQQVDAALCDEPDIGPKRPQSIIPGAPSLSGIFSILGASARAEELFLRSWYESEPVDGIAALNRAIALAPNYPKAYTQRASLYKSEAQFDRALADYDRAFQLQPDDFNLLAAQGLLYGDLQQWEKMITIYDRLYGVRPDLAAHYHTIQARAYAELQQWPEVIQQYTIAIQMNQLEDRARLEFDQTLNQTPPFVTQLEGKMTLLHDPSGQALLYLNRGYAYERQNQTQLATADYTLAFASVELPSSVKELYRSRCRLKVWAGNIIGAKSDARHANETFHARQVQLSKLPPPKKIKHLPPLPQASPPQPNPPTISPSPPNDSGRPVTEAELRDINRLLVMGKNVELGIPPEYFDPAMPMDRDFAPAYYHRGIWRLQTEQFEPVLADFERAIALNPQFSLAHAARGEALRQLKRSDEAMTALDRALQLDPTLAAARLSQGMIWLERGDLKQAESAFNDVLAIDPESIEALTERAKIRRSRRDIMGSTADDRRVKQVRDRWHLPL